MGHTCTATSPRAVPRTNISSSDQLAPSIILEFIARRLLPSQTLFCPNAAFDAAAAAALIDFARAGGAVIVEAPTARRGEDGPYVLEELLGVRYHGRSDARDRHGTKPAQNPPTGSTE